MTRTKNFNPRSPHGERHHQRHDHEGAAQAFQPTLPARGATLGANLQQPHIAISTHAPRTGSDMSLSTSGTRATNFNPRSPHGERRAAYVTTQQAIRISTHAPRTGSDVLHRQNLHGLRQFQPTLPARGATRNAVAKREPLLFQPTLPARGATVPPRVAAAGSGISTHAPRTGSDFLPPPSSPARAIFQPTLPARGATLNPVDSHKSFYDFNPRSPHGERRRACRSGWACPSISTHAPRTGSDDLVHLVNASLDDFNPRSPHGERR